MFHVTYDGLPSKNIPHKNQTNNLYYFQLKLTKKMFYEKSRKDNSKKIKTTRLTYT